MGLIVIGPEKKLSLEAVKKIHTLQADAILEVQLVLLHTRRLVNCYTKLKISMYDLVSFVEMSFASLNKLHFSTVEVIIQ